MTNNGIKSSYKVSGINDYKSYPIDKITLISRILHFKNFNPNDSLYGILPIASAAKSINLHHKILEWNMALLKNSVKPSGSLELQDSNGSLNNEQFERIKEQFYDNFSGSANSGRPLILEGGIKWSESHNAESMEKFLELKDSVSRDIASAFNIPAQMLGIAGDNTYSNMQEARLAFWEENIIPLL